MAPRRGTLAVLLLALAPTTALAADEEPNLDFFYPLVTRRPVIERELEVRFQHDKGHDGRRSELAAAIELPLLPRWQVELEVPVVFDDPREGRATAGPGDVELQNKLLLLKSVERRALVAAGLEVRFPSGSERRRLGGEATIEPFLAAGVALGDVDVLGEVAYEWSGLAHPKEPDQDVSAGVAVGYRAMRVFTPLVELIGLARTRGSEDEGHGQDGEVRISVVPGLNVRPFPGTTARFGIELPVTRGRTSDYTVHGGFVWEF